VRPYQVFPIQNRPSDESSSDNSYTPETVDPIKIKTTVVPPPKQNTEKVKTQTQPKPNTDSHPQKQDASHQHIPKTENKKAIPDGSYGHDLSSTQNVYFDKEGYKKMTSANQQENTYSNVQPVNVFPQSDANNVPNVSTSKDKNKKSKKAIPDGN